MKNEINPIDGIIVESKSSERTVARNGMTLIDILDRMDKIIAQGDDLVNAVAQIRDLPYDFNGKGRSEDLVSIYKAREKTNQKMLSMLNTMYNDMMGKVENQLPGESIMDAIREMDFAGMMPETAKIVVEAMMGKSDA